MSVLTKIKGKKKNIGLLGAILLACVVMTPAVSAYNWDAMSNMSDFVDDVVTFMPKIITLII
jgi:uncharacterized protein involved in tolerance to divalent cations